LAITIYLGGEDGFDATVAALAGISELRHVPAEAAAVAAALTDADAVLDASMKVRITDAMVAAAPRLRIISTATTGSDHIERKVLGERGIPVRTLKEDPDILRNLTPAAELSWAMVMTCARKLTAAVKHVNGGGWTRELFPGLMLNGRTLGLIGCGRIGGWMSRYARAFGMRVQGYDPYLKALPEGIEPASLEQVMASSDVISVHVHLSDETRGLVSRALFESVKPGTIFINTSRGAIADEAALLDGLRSGRIGAAGLDVLEGEPDTAEHPLVRYSREHDNLLITPHCGGFSPDAVRVVCRHAAGKIAAALAA
jgi:phosphoglycerate dehydrogenase-like enzyme